MTRSTTELGDVPGAANKDLAGLSLMVCPKCRGVLVHLSAESALDCHACRLRFPIQDGIPVLMLESSKPIEP